MARDEAATVDGRKGLLRTCPDGSVVWEAEVDGTAVAALVRRAMVHGSLACSVGDLHSVVHVQCVYYDAASGRFVAELSGAPEPVD
jgi:hypothetical protein